MAEATATVEVLKVEEGDARSLFTTLGKVGVEDWNRKKLTARLNDLTAQGQGKELEGESLTLFRQIEEARAEGRSIALDVEEPAEDGSDGDPSQNDGPAVNGQKKTGKKGKGKSVATGKGKKDKANPKTPKTEKVERDKFGCRVGSGAATINEKLSRKAKSVKELAEESGQTPARVSGHIKSLLKKGLVSQTEKGIVVGK